MVDPHEWVKSDWDSDWFELSTRDWFDLPEPEHLPEDEPMTPVDIVAKAYSDTRRQAEKVPRAAG